MDTHENDTLGGLISYLAGLIGMLSQQDILFLLGAATLVLRLASDGLRLWRQWRDRPVKTNLNITIDKDQA